MKRIALKILNAAYLLALFVISSGCAKNHQVLIDPSIPIHSSDMGNGLPVAVKVVDTRPSNIISRWQGGFNVRKFTITSQGDLKDIFTTRVRQGLTMLGFYPKIYSQVSERALKIEILDIKSRYQENPPKINIQVKTSIKAICENRKKRFSKNFTSRKTRSNISPASFPNESLLNNSLSEVMGQIFSDTSLIACLAE